MFSDTFRSEPALTFSALLAPVGNLLDRTTQANLREAKVGLCGHMHQ